MATSGEQGGFRFDDLPRRPLCLVIVVARARLKTGWILV